jgi:polysaccharide pyruvyl transferase WcaK-like protein
LAPGASITAVSGDPAFTKLTYGIDAVSRIGFPVNAPNRIAEQARIDQLVEQAIGGASQIPDAFVALLESDLLMVSGGGNLSSSWPEHILERLALVRLASKRGIPIIVLGQTLGPNLEPEDRLLVAEILEAALWVGLREAPSVALAIELGIPLERIDYQLDDAIFLNGSSVETMWPHALNGAELPCVISLTLHPFVAPDSDNPLLDQLAGELDCIIEETGAHILFLPHIRLWHGGADSGDRIMGEAIARRMKRREAMTVLDVQGARATVWLTQRADMILSSRYHPLVFGLAAGRSCLALPTDEYTQIKLQGAMIHAELGYNIFPIDQFSVSGLADKALKIFASRQEIQPQLERKVVRWRYAELDR